MTNLRLTIEAIPAGSRLSSLARLLPRSRWNRIRRAVYRSASYRCHACGRQRSLDCHEFWQYNERTGYQWLRGFQALCRTCHQVKHILFFRDRRKRARLLQHFAGVNHLTIDQAGQHLDAAQKLQHRLDQHDWVISFGAYNWHMPPLGNLQQRQAYLHKRR